MGPSTYDVTKWSGVGVLKIVTLSDVRGKGVWENVTSPKIISISNIIEFF